MMTICSMPRAAATAGGGDAAAPYTNGVYVAVHVYVNAGPSRWCVRIVMVLLLMMLPMMRVTTTCAVAAPCAAIYPDAAAVVAAPLLRAGGPIYPVFALGMVGAAAALRRPAAAAAAKTDDNVDQQQHRIATNTSLPLVPLLVYGTVSRARNHFSLLILRAHFC